MERLDIAENFTLYCGDAIEVLRSLPEGSLHCCITSPPYFGLRDYGVSGQIGLEATPDEYVSKLVAVFREVRRVLCEAGTLWLNIGDTYYSTTKGSGGRSAKQSSNAGSRFKQRRFKCPGLKPKDLCLIPSRLAQALQEPYYTGRIKNIQDRIWLAAIIEAEGCLYIGRSKKGTRSGRRSKATGEQSKRTMDSFGPSISVCNTSERIIRRCHEIAGCGTVHTTVSKRNRRTYYTWVACSNDARSIAQEIYPHLVTKQHEARILFSSPSSGVDAATCWESLKLLHKGNPALIDFPPPPDLFEDGWYLRSEIVWSKPNPMPESVQDRPTTAHEKIFLLSKSPKYFYDADAIAEPATTGERFNGSKKNKQNKDRMDGNNGARNGVALPPIQTRNRRNVWSVVPASYQGAHFAVMPKRIVEFCLFAGCPVGGTCLDVFSGAGTTGLVANENGRAYIGIELSPEYCELTKTRYAAEGPKPAANLDTLFDADDAA